MILVDGSTLLIPGIRATFWEAFNRVEPGMVEVRWFPRARRLPRQRVAMIGIQLLEDVDSATAGNMFARVKYEAIRIAHLVKISRSLVFDVYEVATEPPDKVAFVAYAVVVKPRVAAKRLTHVRHRLAALRAVESGVRRNHPILRDAQHAFGQACRLLDKELA